MKALKGVAVLLLAATPVLGFAQDKPKKELNPWIDCGIGAMIFEDLTWAAVSSNIIWDLGTTAVTSDQSSQNTCNSKKAKTALYIGVNYANLSEETAKGGGKHLSAMFDMVGCNAATQGAVIADVRSQYGAALSDAGYAGKSSAAKAESFYDIVQRSAAKCQI